MKLRYLFCTFLFIISCDDGDLAIETIDFDDVAIQQCTSVVTTQTRLFFKINEDEALILRLQSGLLKNEASNGDIVSSVPSQSQVTYRILSDQADSGYFCDAIPPITPVAIEDIEGSGGEVIINTVPVVVDNDTVYEHTIQLSGISFVTESGERITDLRINDFGSVTTGL